MIIFVNYLQRFSVSSELVSMFLLLYFMDVGRQVCWKILSSSYKKSDKSIVFVNLESASDKN